MNSPGARSHLLRHHVRQQRIRGDVERHAEEDVGAALVELARQPAVGDVELEQCVARRQRHVLELADVPRVDDDAARIGIAAEQARLRARSGRSCGRRRCATSAIARRRPDRARRCASAHSSQIVTPWSRRYATLVSPRRNHSSSWTIDLQVQPLGRDQREALRQVEAHLVAEHAARAGAGAVGLERAVLEHVAHQVEVLRMCQGCSCRTARCGDRRARASRRRR